MSRSKIALICIIFFVTAMLISRAAAGRPVQISVKTEMESNQLDRRITAVAPRSDDLAPAESREGSENGESAEKNARDENHPHSSDKSIAGGGVIIGGLVTVTFAAVYCYIRVTRKRDGEN